MDNLKPINLLLLFTLILSITGPVLSANIAYAETIKSVKIKPPVVIAESAGPLKVIVSPDFYALYTFTILVPDGWEILNAVDIRAHGGKVPALISVYHLEPIDKITGLYKVLRKVDNTYVWITTIKDPAISGYKYAIVVSPFGSSNFGSKNVIEVTIPVKAPRVVQSYEFRIFEKDISTISVGSALPSVKSASLYVIETQLMELAANITGTVVDKDTNQAIERAVIEVYRGDSLEAIAYSDSSGKFEIAGLAPGTYTIIAYKRPISEGAVASGYYIEEPITVKLLAKTRQGVKLELSSIGSASSIKGTIERDTTSAYAPDTCEVLVSVYKAGTKDLVGRALLSFGSGETKKNYEITGLSKGYYDVVVTMKTPSDKNYYPRKALNVYVPPSSIVTVNFIDANKLRVGGTLELKVSREEGTSDKAVGSNEELIVRVIDEDGLILAEKGLGKGTQPPVEDGETTIVFSGLTPTENLTIEISMAESPYTPDDNNFLTLRELVGPFSEGSYLIKEVKLSQGSSIRLKLKAEVPGEEIGKINIYITDIDGKLLARKTVSPSTGITEEVFRGLPPETYVYVKVVMENIDDRNYAPREIRVQTPQKGGELIVDDLTLEPLSEGAKIDVKLIRPANITESKVGTIYVVETENRDRILARYPVTLDADVKTVTLSGLPDAPAGAYTVIVDIEGFLRIEKKTEIESIKDVSQVLEVSLTDKPIVKGHIKYKMGVLEKPLPWATVRIAQSPAVVIETLSDDEGYYEVAELLPGEYVLTVSKIGFISKSVPLTIEDTEESIEVSVSLEVSEVIIPEFYFPLTILFALIIVVMLLVRARKI